MTSPVGSSTKRHRSAAGTIPIGYGWIPAGSDFPLIYFRRCWKRCGSAQGQQRAAQFLEDRYYGGGLPLFLEVAEDLEQQIEQMQGMIGIFNESIELWASAPAPHRKRSKPVLSEPPLVMAALEPAVQQYGEQLAAYLTDLAQAEALRFVGDPQSARAYLTRHLVETDA
jgi:hypothetical protein